MREIKFDYIIKDPVNDELYHCPYTLNQVQDSTKLTDVEMQGRIVAKRLFTGLLDKNGREIYEGDLLKQDMYSSVREVIYLTEVAQYRTSDKDGFCGVDLSNHCEVIGNIYESPELLNKD